MLKKLLPLGLLLLASNLFAAGYDYDVIGQLTAQGMLYVTGGIAMIMGIAGILIAAWKWKITGNHAIIIIGIIAVMFIMGAATLAQSQKSFAQALFTKPAEANGTFK